jgi:hypothetical protein
MRSAMTKSKPIPLAFALVRSPYAVFCAALAIRLWLLHQLLPEKAWKYFYAYNEFARIAWLVVTGHGYSSPWPNTPLLPTAVEPPFYTTVLIGIFRVFGPYSYAALWTGAILNAIMSSATAVMILKLGKRDFDPLVGVLAAWFWAGSLYEAAASVRLWESSLATFLLVFAVWWLPALAESDRLFDWIGFGVLAAISGLTNTTMLAVFPCFYLWFWTKKSKAKESHHALGLAACVFVLALVPWTVRNYVVFHHIFPVRDNFGLELWIGNHEGATEERQYPAAFPILDPGEYNQMGEVPFMQSKREIALRFIREHPADFLYLAYRRVCRFWGEPKGSPWLIVSPLAWIGLACAFYRLLPMRIPYAIVMLVFPLVYYITHTFPTYRHPIEPVILLLASYAAWQAMKSIVEAARSGRGSVRSHEDTNVPSAAIL